MAKPLIILVTGAPASGKTTLSRRLATNLRLPLIARDDVKETLFNTLGWSTVEWSQKLGHASFELMYLMIEKLLSVGVSHMIDCNFDPEYATERWLDFSYRYPFEPFQIICRTQDAVLLQRYAARIKSGERHPGHIDRLRMGELDPAEIARRYVPMPIGGQSTLLDTTDFTDAHYDALLAQIRSLAFFQSRDGS
ncbi:MAG: AAA family ATPase [Caldilineaceae bacterium]|nr:AAA family ATPase [Caldilineaceae bacterium]